MAILKKTAAFFTAVMIAACVTGCADTSYALKADNEKVKAGIYIDYIYNELSNQINSLYQSGVTSDFLNQKIDGKNFTDYVADTALVNTKEHVAINNKFDELKLTLDDETVKTINSNVSDIWEQSGEAYEKQGISRDSLKEVYLNSAKRTAIFEYYYAKDGKEAVSDEDLVSYVNDNYIRFKVISIPKATDDEEADKENKETRDKFLKMAEGLSFEEFDSVIDAYNEYQEEQAAQESADSTESTDQTDSSDSVIEESSSAEETVSSMADDTSSEIESENADESAEDSVADSISDSADESAVDDSSEEDPYINETMTNYSELDDEYLESANGKVLTEVKNLDEGKAAAYEDENAYYILIKGNVSKRSKEYTTDEENHDNILFQMKSKDFQKYVDEWVKKISFDINDQAIKRYTVETVYNIQNEANK